MLALLIVFIMTQYPLMCLLMSAGVGCAGNNVYTSNDPGSRNGVYTHKDVLNTAVYK